MSIKSILVHLASDAGHVARLDAARALATRLGAHLEILYITRPVHMPAGAAGRTASSAYLREAQERSQARAEAIRKEMEELDPEIDLSWEFRIDNGDHLEVLTEYSHFVDLAIVGKAPEEGAVDTVMLHRPDDLLLSAGCPVLVMPPVVRAPLLEGPVLVAWKAGKEVSRAVRGAMPFLTAAPRVHVLAARRKGGVETPGLRLCGQLARHGAQVELLPEDDDRGQPGERIIAQSRAWDCAMIVMGAYGKRGLREMIFGGTTRYMLKHMDRPVLLSG